MIHDGSRIGAKRPRRPDNPHNLITVCIHWYEEEIGESFTYDRRKNHKLLTRLKQICNRRNLRPKRGTRFNRFFYSGNKLIFRVITLPEKIQT